MLWKKFKRTFYFVVASYFGFWAKMVLKRWRPRIVVVTGSSGKTTALHLVEAQLGEKAIYSHHANSTFGVPFHILGLKRRNYHVLGWFVLAIRAPFQSLKKTPEQKIYVVEADSDRVREGQFLARLLQPDVVMWVSSGRTHSMNFDKLVDNGTFLSVEEAVAFGFGFFIENARELVLLNADDNHIATQVERAKVKVKELHKSELLAHYEIKDGATHFRTQRDNEYVVPALLPEVSFYGVAMTHMLMKFLGQPFDNQFKKYEHPPGRSSLFKASSGAKLFDSSYNANFASMQASLNLFAQLPGKKRWAVVGDMIEQGEGEREEHERLADLIMEHNNFERIILMGPRVKRFTKPALKKQLDGKVKVVDFEEPKPLLDYLAKELGKNELVFFKGARFLEGVIEHLLADKSDADKLCRREPLWQKHRTKWGVGPAGESDSESQS